MARRTHTFAGEGLGTEAEQSAFPSAFQPVLTYRVELPPGCDVHGMLRNLRTLEEEEPELHITWDETHGEIHVQVMGEVQTEIFRDLVAERFGVAVSLTDGSIVYKETIRTAAEGIGHFEPLRHYAEEHLLQEPGERGSGLSFSSALSEDVLDRNWQRLILSHLAEKRHVGVLTGSELTDVKITLVAGRAHLKHTEGGDFREATYRAVRQGLMKAESVLLEPVYDFVLSVPGEVIGRAMTDIRRMSGTFDAPASEGDMSILAGQVPASELGDYAREVTAYSRGRGHLSLSLHGYAPCHNQEEVVAAAGYDPESDLENPPDSVFCSHGAGFVVPWREVPDFAHGESGLSLPEEEDAPEAESGEPVRRFEEMRAADNELMAIFERTYGPVKAKVPPGGARGGTYDYGDYAEREEKPPLTGREGRPSRVQPKDRPEEVLLVDGYNIIFSWDELNALSKDNLEAARSTLQDILSDYQGYRGMHLILVFDAYKVEGAVEESFRYPNIDVVYTREGEKADQYIERTAHEIGRTCPVTVATSDNLEQVTVMGQGARRMSARELLAEVKETREEVRREYIGKGTGSKNLLIYQAPDEMAEWMEDVRLGKKRPDEAPGPSPVFPG